MISKHWIKIEIELLSLIGEKNEYKMIFLSLSFNLYNYHIAICLSVRSQILLPFYWIKLFFSARQKFFSKTTFRYLSSHRIFVAFYKWFFFCFNLNLTNFFYRKKTISFDNDSLKAFFNFIMEILFVVIASLDSVTGSQSILVWRYRWKNVSYLNRRFRLRWNHFVKQWNEILQIKKTWMKGRCYDIYVGFFKLF